MYLITWPSPFLEYFAAMSYYMRILGTNDPMVSVEKLGKDLEVVLSYNDVDGRWSFMEMANMDEEVFAHVERNPIQPGQIGQEELEEFKETILNYAPASAANWLLNYFEGVKVIYAFELMDIVFEEDNAGLFDEVYERIWKAVGGIKQADHEGFSNEAGDHIIWMFDDADEEGPLRCAVLDEQGGWQSFEMDLENKAQREAFLAGKVPPGTKK